MRGIVKKCIILEYHPSPPLVKRPLLTILFLALLAIPALPATFYVTSNGDNGAGTLRDALTQAAANGTATTDYIYFNLADPTMAGRTIDLLTELPPLSSNLVIDGTSQSGTPFYTTDARIFIRMMTYATQFSMLKVYNCTSVQIYGLYLYYGDWLDALFSSTNIRTHTLFGIDLSNSSNITIGAPGKGNVLNGEATGIWCGDNTSGTHDITIQSNYIGCGLYPSAVSDVDTYIMTMDAGIHLQNVPNITIGGASAAAGNVICGHQGLWVGSRVTAIGNGELLIQNNHFARGFDKTTLLSGFDFVQYIQIGLTSYLHDYALQLLDNDIPERVSIANLTVNFVIKHNIFGIAPDFNGVDDTKLLITYCSGGVIGGDDPADANQFLFGQHPGYSVHTGTVGPITSLKNSYECNSQYGSTTLNQFVDVNYVVPFVQVNQPSPSVVSGISTPNCRIDLYYDDECSACEGKIYIGKTQSDASGNWTYGGPVNGTVVATATDGAGRTGDFSAPRFFTSGMKIVSPSCGNANGSITGITSDGAETFYWVNLTTGATVSHSLDLTNAGPGEYVLYGVHGGTCIKPISQSIGLSDVTPHIQTGNVQITPPGCGRFYGSIAGMTVSGAYNVQYAWINGLGQTVSTARDLANAGPGQYKLVVTDAVTGCSDQTGFYQLVNQPGPTVDISQVLVTGTTCRDATGGISNVLTGNVTGQPSFTWIDAGGKTVGNSVALSGVPAGPYQLVFKDQGVCPAITTPPITIGNTGGDVVLTVNQVTTTDESCERKNASIHVQDISPAPTGFQFTWIDDATGQLIGTGTSITNLVAGSYSLAATDATGCPQMVKTFQLKDDPAPAIDMTAAVITADTCSQDIGAITGVAVKGTPSFNYTWYSTSGVSVSGAKDLTSIGKGSYYLVVNDQNNCSTTGAPMNVGDVDQQLAVPAYDDVFVPKGQPATLTIKSRQSGTYDLYSSDPGSSASGPAQTNTSGNFTTGTLSIDTTVYVVLRKGDCSSAPAAINIKVLASLDLIVPTAFSPNGDGHNDLFRIKNPQLVRTFAMIIVDRWGEKVFESADPYQGWNGSRGGNPASPGTYVWMIHYRDILGREKSIRGTVILIR